MSLDTAEQNAAFAKEMDARTPVVSDPDGAAAKRFGVLGFGGLYANRWTFYIDGEGVIRYVDRNVNPASAGQDILERLDALDFPRLSSEAPPSPGAGGPDAGP